MSDSRKTTTPNSSPLNNTIAPPQNRPGAGSLFMQLLVNILIPTLILIYFKKDTFLGSLFDTWIEDGKSFNKIALLIALAFPIGFGCLDFFDRHKVNFFSIVGTVSIALTGGMGVFEIDPKYIAIKEAAVPGLFGIVTLCSLLTPYPLVRSLVFNEQIMQVKKIETILAENNSAKAFEKTLSISTVILAGSFLLASITNYFLAIFILVSQPGTDQFNDEMARMIALSYPVNALPALIVMGFALYYTYRNIRKYTDLPLEEIMNLPEEPDSSTDEQTDQT